MFGFSADFTLFARHHVETIFAPVSTPHRSARSIFVFSYFGMRKSAFAIRLMGDFMSAMNFDTGRKFVEKLNVISLLCIKPDIIIKIKNIINIHAYKVIF